MWARGISQCMTQTAGVLKRVQLLPWLPIGVYSEQGGREIDLR